MGSKHLLALLSVTLPILTLNANDAYSNIVDSMGKLESKRDPKCYATATRLENFMYGTPLSHAARFEKNLSQKNLIKDIWERATHSLSPTQKVIEGYHIKSILDTLFTQFQKENGDFLLRFPNKEVVNIASRDIKHYGSVAYALRALAAVQQDHLLSETSPLENLSQDAVREIKKGVDLFTLAVLKRCDENSRVANLYEIDKDLFRHTWNTLLAHKDTENIKKRPEKDKNRMGLLQMLIEEKLKAYQAYNEINNQLFVRNLQVYFAKLRWPGTQEEANKFKNAFTEIMISFTSQILLAENHR
jgi:hypothetical protein